MVATLKSGGVRCPPDPILTVTDRTGGNVPLSQQPCEQVIAPGVANTLMAGLSKDTTIGTSAAAARAAGSTRPDIGKTGTTETSESVAFLGGVNDYAVASIVFASGSRPQELCPDRHRTWATVAQEPSVAPRWHRPTSLLCENCWQDSQTIRRPRRIRRFCSPRATIRSRRIWSAGG